MKFKDTVKHCAAKCLNALHSLMPEILYNRATAYYEKVSVMNQKLAVLPTTVE